MLQTTATELPRLMQCVGSADMPRALPKDSNKEARDEGNAAHEVAEKLFRGESVKSGDKASNGYVITDAMIDHAEQYVSDLDCQHIEIETSWGSIAGRADHVSFRDGVLTIDDFKYGWSIVEPDMNWTLISHAVGWVMRSGEVPSTIKLVIHQPRPLHHKGTRREWSCSYDQLVSFKTLIEVRLSENDRSLTTGPLCKKCHALPTCAAAREASYNAVDVQVPPHSDDLDGDMLAHSLTQLERAKAIINARHDAIEELVKHKLTNAAVIPGYGLENRYAQRKFKSGITPDAFKALTGVDGSKPGLISPAEAERRGVPKSVVKTMTDRPLTGSKLVKVDANEKARSIFGEES